MIFFSSISVLYFLDKSSILQKSLHIYYVYLLMVFSHIRFLINSIFLNKLAERRDELSKDFLLDT